MQVFVSGSLAYDRIMNFPGKFADHILPEKIHVLNVCFTVDGLQEKFGGTAGNIAYSLALLEERPVILAAAGRDFGVYQEWLDRHGLPLTGIKRVDDEFTAGAYITTDQSDNQITGFNPGAMKYASDYDFNGVDPADALAIISPGNLDDMLGYSRTYKEKRIPYIFDPGQQIPIIPADWLREMLEGSAVLISNDYELELICKASGWSRDSIQERTGAVITTLGENGSLVRENGREIAVDVVPARRVMDPTGAGDAFRSGLLKGLVMKKDLVEAARMGSASASFAVESYGTQEHCYTLDEFWDRYRQTFG